MPRRSKRSRRRWRLITAIILAPILAYFAAAAIGSLVPVNRGWREPAHGTLVYLANNGVHTDLVMPVSAGGLDWRPLFPSADFAAPPPDPRWVAVGAGERHIYFDTPRWRDLKLGTALRAVAGGERVIHVALLTAPPPDAREIRLRPQEYRRLWAAVRADFTLDSSGRPRLLDHPGYGGSDAFYAAPGRIGAIRTCNVWAADKLRLAGVRTSLWPPFAQGLAWRYRTAGDQRPPQR